MTIRKTLSLLLSGTIFSLSLVGCSLPQLSSNLYQTAGSTSEISYSAYDKAESQSDILAILLTAMQNNESTCYFSVSDESMINADLWLNSLSGIQEIHCEYRKIKEAYNVVVTLKYWDNYAIVNAFRTGNTSHLNNRQLELHDKYCEVLNTITSPSTTPWDNELAIHDYLVDNIAYVLDENSAYNAYDALLKGRAFCSGYAECFKTFMDMLGIECTTISGTAGDESHVWNLVKLENSWYQVDVTWDDPINSTGAIGHEYFNITDKDMAIDHNWQTTNYVNADGTIHSYANITGLSTVTTQNELNKLLANVVKKRQSTVEFIVTDSLDLRTAIENTDVSMSYSYKITERVSYSLYLLQFTYD